MKTRQFTSIVILLVLLVSQSVSAQSKSKIIGIWYNSDKTAQIEIMENADEMIGKLVWIQREDGDPAVFTDLVNADTSLRNRPLMGLTILKGLKFKNGIWSEGEIYDPESGLSYNCELQLKKKDILEIRGFLGDTWVSRTVEWNRVKK
ncbi:DUF2147 domain-containing protein [Algoriphagus yeomjeoni]|uniref:Uncharacterized protein (DUF2147 family) n=1 Tax=Algoriphagus yeomjeoni TaxID=291403 RepID=A0A327PJG7_9BACT|nr:DUF2147 domain-containing protein [Algoriphagus yeomjeoni]RAI91352.1 uncharacterized protein (DUF2147 family) [Algoriphagus yeomjeoni]